MHLSLKSPAAAIFEYYPEIKKSKPTGSKSFVTKSDIVKETVQVHEDEPKKHTKVFETQQPEQHYQPGRKYYGLSRLKVHSSSSYSTTVKAKPVHLSIKSTAVSKDYLDMDFPLIKKSDPTESKSFVTKSDIVKKTVQVHKDEPKKQHKVFETQQPEQQSHSK